jgi:hypothetical protein
MSKKHEVPVSEREPDHAFEKFFEGIYGKRLQARFFSPKTDCITDAELQELRFACEKGNASSGSKAVQDDLARAVWYETYAREIYDCRHHAAREAWDAAKKLKPQVTHIDSITIQA